MNYIKNAVVLMTIAFLTVLTISSFTMAISSENQSNINFLPKQISTIQNTINKIDNANEINLDNTFDPFAITWSVSVDFNEPGSAYTNVVFGEGPDASDGQDSYDTPMPPPPQLPYIRSWFVTNLTSPYNTLLKDYRHYPDTYKVWNLSVQWAPADYVSPTTITMSWDVNSVNASEYDFAILYNSTGVNVANMLASSSHTFTCPAFLPQNFQIICNTDLESPEITDNSPSTGETGDQYTFNATITDNLADASSLIVNVDWSHGSLSGNYTMTNVPGTNYFINTTTLDESTSDLTYHFYAQDNAKVPNTNYTTELSANIADDEYPTPTSDDTTTTLTTGESITFGLTITDNIDVNYTYANYRWKQGGTWGSWNTNVAMSEGASNDWTTSGLSTPSSATNVEYYFEVNDYTYTVYVYNGSLAVTLTESVAQDSAFSNLISDNDDPTLTDDSPVSGTTGDDYVFDVTPDDNIGVSGVTVTWSHGSLGGTDVDMIDDLDGSYSLTVTLDDSLSDMDYTITVTDTSSNTFTDVTQHVTVSDNDPPLLSGITATPDTQIIDGYVNITATATDNININTIKVDITGPNDFTPINVSMTQNGGNVYYYYNNYSIVGTYNYSIWVSDAAGNGVTSTIHQFVIIAEIKVSDIVFKWNFISVPTNQSVNKEDLFIIQNGSRYNWSESVDVYIDNHIYKWNRTAIPQCYNTTDVLNPGEGYWIYAYDHPNMELWVTGIGPITVDNYITPLEVTWNIVGIPVNQTVNKTDLVINYGGTDYNWSEAVTNGYVVQFIYGWNSTVQNYQNSDILEAGKCYWMYAYVACDLKWM